MNKYVKIKIDYNGEIAIYQYERDYQFGFNDYFVVETKYGHDIGKILSNSIPINLSDKAISEYKILHPATESDFEKLRECKEKAKEAIEITKEKILNHNLSMKLVSIHFFLDRSKILFTFTAEGRIDFRDLVKDLAATFKTRIELRQINVRDAAVILGGYGICGREFCCKNRYNSSEPISIKMAKDQNLTLNSVKISGVCGRLMCCLDFELSQYVKDDPELNALSKINNATLKGEYADYYYRSIDSD